MAVFGETWPIFSDSPPVTHTPLLSCLFKHQHIIPPPTFICLFCHFDLFISVLSKHGTICCLGIFSPVIAYLNLSTQQAACQSVCGSVWDSVELVEAEPMLRGRSGSAAKLLSWVRQAGTSRGRCTGPPAQPNYLPLCGGSWPRVTNSITRSGVIIINTLWALTAHRWFIKNVDYILSCVTTFWIQACL